MDVGARARTARTRSAGTFIAEKVWEASYDLETNLIEVYIRRLRRKLEISPYRPVIKTVRGSGYCVNGPAASSPSNAFGS